MGSQGLRSTVRLNNIINQTVEYYGFRRRCATPHQPKEIAMAVQGTLIKKPRVVSHEQWIKQRGAFMAKEKELTRLRDELSRQRRELPWEKVTKSYVFDGTRGKET